MNALLVAFAAGAGGVGLYSYSRLSELAVAAQIVVYCLIPMLVAVLICASLALSFEAKVNLLTAMVSLGLALVLAESILAAIPAARVPREVADRAGGQRDTRSYPELLTDLWSAGEEAYPFLPASKSREFRVTVAGLDTFSLSGGLADSPVVFCQDAEEWHVYQSDEHGFNNDRGGWDMTPQIVLIGDSYTHGWCVDRDETIAAVLAREWPRTLNLGVSGSGPLTELAVLREFAAGLAPETVVWLYYEGNDLPDLRDELLDPILVNYFESGFVQGIPQHQQVLDDGLRARLDALRTGSSEGWLADRPTDGRPWRPFRLARVQELLLGAVVPFPGSRSQQLEEVPRIIELAARATEDWGGDFYFVYLPAYSRYASRVGEVKGDRREILAALERLQIPVIDIVDAFDDLDDPRAMWLSPQSHFTAAGYRHVAETIAAAISRGDSPR